MDQLLLYYNLYILTPLSLTILKRWHIITPYAGNLAKIKGGINMGYAGGHRGYGGGFALIVVLFILLIIVGAGIFGGYGGF